MLHLCLLFDVELKGANQYSSLSRHYISPSLIINVVMIVLHYFENYVISLCLYFCPPDHLYRSVLSWTLHILISLPFFLFFRLIINPVIIVCVTLKATHFFSILCCFSSRQNYNSVLIDPLHWKLHNTSFRLIITLTIKRKLHVHSSPLFIIYLRLIITPVLPLLIYIALKVTHYLYICILLTDLSFPWTRLEVTGRPRSGRTWGESADVARRSTQLRIISGTTSQSWS